MYFLDTVKEKIVKEVNKALKTRANIELADLVYPPSFTGASAGTVGDISLPCFGLAKIMGKNPAEVAKELEAEIKDAVCSVSSAGPYLNFTLNKSTLSTKVLGEVSKKGKKYGENKSGGKKKILVEFANQNTHKEVHVGHVRNFSYGDSVYKLLKANGFEAMPFSYINDFGINVAKTLWHYDKVTLSSGTKQWPSKATYKLGYILAQNYVEATKKMDDMGDEAKKEVGEYMKAIELRTGRIYELWKDTREWSIKGFEKIYKDLGIQFVDTWYENEFIEEGFRLVDELKKKGVLIESQGAVIADLEQFGLGVLVVLRADGTALYPVADLALAKAKFDKFGIDGSIYVVDIRQSQYFKQLFKVLELMGYEQQMTHLGFDFVTLPGGAMSSRSGNVVTYEDLKSEILKKATNSTKEKHPEWKDDDVKKVAKKIAYGAMKFEMIKVGREKTITFDIEKSLRFDGFTSAYLQYTGARINSILKKVVKNSEVDYAKLSEPKEGALVLKLAKYPEILFEAGKDYEPSEIAKYLFELAQMSNDYYHAVPVLKAEKEVMNARLVLLAAVKQILENGLKLLGIEFINEM